MSSSATYSLDVERVTGRGATPAPEESRAEAATPPESREIETVAEEDVLWLALVLERRETAEGREVLEWEEVLAEIAG